MSQASTIAVLDASAVLALLQEEEEGADEVEAALDGALMSCVNLSEVLQKAEQHGADVEGLCLEYDLEALGVEFRPFEVRRPGSRRRSGRADDGFRWGTAPAWRSLRPWMAWPSRPSTGGPTRSSRCRSA